MVPKNAINKTTVVSAGGSAEINYALTISNVLVSGMSNEYTPARQKMAIIGQSFDLHVFNDEKGKILWDGPRLASPKPLPILSISWCQPVP